MVETTVSIPARTNTYAYGTRKMPYKSKAQARAVLANTSESNPRHAKARGKAKAKLKKRNGLMPSRT